MGKKFDIDLSGKTVVITGAGGVICGAIARALAPSGANLALLDLNEEAAAAVAADIDAAGGKARAYKCNVLDKASLLAVRDAVEKDFGLCDILINGAGGNNPRATTDNEFCLPDVKVGKDFFALEDGGVRFVFELNFIGTFLPKAGISNFTEWLAVHFAPAGIRVNAIAPGFFVTNQNRALLFDKDGSPTARTDKILRATPMGRFGEVEEIMGAVKLLLNDEEASFITGVVIPVDGGFNAYSGV